jgi:hypothetical protein
MEPQRFHSLYTQVEDRKNKDSEEAWHKHSAASVDWDLSIGKNWNIMWGNSVKNQ